MRGYYDTMATALEKEMDVITFDLYDLGLDSQAERLPHADYNGLLEIGAELERALFTSNQDPDIQAVYNWFFEILIKVKGTYDSTGEWIVPVK